MPAIRALGCCGRLGTWSAACGRAGFLWLPAQPASTVLQGSCWPPALGTQWHTVHGTQCPGCAAGYIPALPTLPQGALQPWCGFEVTLEQLCCKDQSRAVAIPAAGSQECAEYPASFCPAEQREVGVPLCSSALNMAMKCVPKRLSEPPVLGKTFILNPVRAGSFLPYEVTHGRI